MVAVWYSAPQDCNAGAECAGREDHMTEHTAWKRHLDGFADEIMRLTAVCDVDLRVPGNIERVLQGDRSVCHQKNPAAFDKLQKVLGMTYQSLNKAVGRIGPEETRALTEEIIARVDQHRAAGGRKPGHGGSPFDPS